MLLADAAERSLGVQYCIWRGDLSGTLLLEALHRAAERGARVRAAGRTEQTSDVGQFYNDCAGDSLEAEFASAARAPMSRSIVAFVGTPFAL